MEQMTWSAWGVDGARGTGTDSAIECKPSCAEGTGLFNPIVVHAWIQPGSTWSPGTEFVTVDDMPAVHFSGLTPACAPL
jgi:hypothetical protein